MVKNFWIKKYGVKNILLKKQRKKQSYNSNPVGVDSVHDTNNPVILFKIDLEKAVQMFWDS